MKQIIFIFSILLATVSYATAQTTSLTFTGRNQNNGYVQLDHVIIKNLTKDWQEILYWPDTVLTMTYTGIENHVGAKDNSPLQWTQNNPNPFDGTTYATLILAKDGDVSVEITDVTGRIVETQKFSSLQQSTLELRISLSTAGMYFLTARQNGLTTSIKMINRGNGGTDNIAITSNVGSQFTTSALPKHTNSNKGTTNNPFDTGDQMEYMGYADFNGTEIESVHLNQAQNSSQDITLEFVLYPSYFDGIPCLGMNTLKDYDGNTYNTVQIGKQCWMKENLRTTHFANGDTVFMGIINSDTIPYRYYPNYNAGNVTSYGYLYNWAAIMHGETSNNNNPSNIRGICPNGWHVPSHAEWKQLTDYVSSQEQYQWGCPTCIAKSLAATYGWLTYTYGNVIGNDMSANNGTGFTALPAGYYGYGGQYSNFGEKAIFGCSTEASTYYTRLRTMSYNEANISEFGNDKKYGYSIRCVCDSLPHVTTMNMSNVTTSSAIGGGSIAVLGNIPVSSYGLCWSTSHNPTLSDSHTTEGTGIGDFTSNLTSLLYSTTFYVRAYATNSYGTSYGNEVQFTTPNDAPPCPGTPTVTDVDGNIYNTIQIGNQCWTKENMRATHFADGTVIPSNGESEYGQPHRDAPNNDINNVPEYGYLYNWWAMMHTSESTSGNPSNVQGVCPNGWHVPSDAEWNEMEATLTDVDLNVFGPRGDHACKLSGGYPGSWTEYGYADNVPGDYDSPERNITGFSALPAGTWDKDTHSPYGFHHTTTFWSTTDIGSPYPSSTTGFARRFEHTYISVRRCVGVKVCCYSVRCVRN